MAALGVGVLYNPALRELLRSDPGLGDYVSVVPETFWVDAENDVSPGVPRFAGIREAVDVLDELADRRPVVAHGIRLSVGSAEVFDEELVAEVARWRDRYDFRWYGEHLAFSRVRFPGGRERHVGLALNPPYDADVLDLVCDRVRTVTGLVDAPFALENGVTYTTPYDQDMSEPAFLNGLVARTGCHVLLDLHNLYTNVRNGLVDADDYLAELDLDAVLELHVAGGDEIAGFYTDSHAGRCPPEVWRLLADVLPYCPNVRGVTFEFHQSYYPALGEQGVRDELAHAREIWDRCR